MPEAKLRFPVEAGLAVRGQIKRSIMRGAWDHGLDVTVEEDKGLLDSLYYFEVTGPVDRLEAFREAFDNWSRQF